jgi:antitoxin (DNA-binding transcriptional repressor) of toxin-antitoxin stability system
MVLTLNVREIRAALPKLEQVLREQGEVVIIKRGRPIARVLPMPAGSMPSHADFRATMPRPRVGSEHYVRADRDER